MKKKLKKAIEWLKDNWDIPYWKCYWLWRDIRGWWWHNMNKAHFHLVKEAWLSYPFDFAFRDIGEGARHHHRDAIQPIILW